MLRGINTNVELTAYSKSDTPPAHFVALFHEMVAKYFSDTVHIYTDGSKMDTKSGSAIVFPGQPDQSASFRLPDNTSIFTAEGFALLFALGKIEEILPHNQFTIFSDSLSCILALNNHQHDNIYIRRAADKLDRLTDEGIAVSICWIPSHVGIPGNELADEAAKQALELDIQYILQPHNDSRQAIRQYINAKWQAEWDEVGNDLHRALPLLPHKYSAVLPRREERVLARLHIGHTRLTHSYRLDRTDRPQCATCQEDLTISHLLSSCQEHLQLREELFGTKTLT
jgi:ribonuclease HI